MESYAFEGDAKKGPDTFSRICIRPHYLRFNLYDVVFNDSDEFKALSHGKKAGQRAPYWAAEIRLVIDQILSEAKGE